jgi:hypothetical protein
MTGAGDEVVGVCLVMLDALMVSSCESRSGPL